MAAVLALQLVEKSELDLDAGVRQYVPEFPDKGVPITARELLCHATKYGLGFVVEDGRQGLKVSHNGSQTETTTRMVLYPRTGRGVVVMYNCGFAKIGEVSTAVYTALRGH
jgi:hypothetical protein